MAEDTTPPSPDHGTQSIRAKMPSRKLLLGLLLVSIVGLISVAGIHQWRQYFSTLNVLARKARHGDAGAAFELGKSYERGLSGATKDAQRAAQWYRQAAEAGDMHAQNNLGVMYKRGDGIPKDDAAAFDWFRKAAEQGDRIAEWNLARAYQSGLGVPQSFPDSISWARKAAEQGYAPAQAGLCAMYWIGHGVERDLTLAYAWCLISKASGFDKGKDLADSLGKRLSASEQTEAQQLASTWWSGRHQSVPMPEHSKEFTKLPQRPSNPAQVFPLRNVPRQSRPQVAGGRSSSGCESGHWIDSVSDDGSIVKLDDGSVWEVSDVDAIDSELWLPTEDIVVCHGKLVNTDDHESVEAVRVK